MRSSESIALAERVAAELGIQEVIAEVLPADHEPIRFAHYGSLRQQPGLAGWHDRA